MDFYSIQQSKNTKKNPENSTEFVARSLGALDGLKSTLSSVDIDYFRILFLRTLGNFLVLFSLYMLTWVFYEPVKEEIIFAYNNATGKTYVVAEELDQLEDNPTFTASKGSEESGLLSSFLATQKVEALVPRDPNFSVVIPKLGANANIIANVNSANADEYLSALQTGVAHAAGTAFPGQNQHVYLFAHSTNTFSNVSRYNAIFYLLYKLENGDEVNVYYQGVRHKYIVTGKTVVDPSEVEYLTRKTDSEFLTLQTCWPPGTVAKRMLVFAEPVIVQ